MTIKGRKVIEFKNRDKVGNLKTVGKFEIRNQAEDFAELYIYGDIVSSEWMKWDDSDTCPDDVANFLKEIEGVNKLNIYINSGGGSVFAGLAIYNQLRRNKAEKTVYVDGLAGSISSVIMFAGNKVIVPSNAFVMIHKPWYGIWGRYNADEFRKMADDLDKIEEGILNVYEQHLKDGVDIETIRQLVQEETWLTGEQAAEYFDIEIGEESKAAACVSDYFNSYKNTPKELLSRPKQNESIKDEEIEALIARVNNIIKFEEERIYE